MLQNACSKKNKQKKKHIIIQEAAFFSLPLVASHAVVNGVGGKETETSYGFLIAVFIFK